MRAPLKARLAPDEQRQLWERLRSNDPVASSDLCVCYYEWLIAALARRYPWVDPHDVATAAHDALVNLIKNPTSYDPTRQSLDAYLRMSADGDLKNRLSREQRHRRRRADLEAVEASAEIGNYHQGGLDDPEAVVIAQETVAERRRRQQEELERLRRSSALTPEEQTVLDLEQAGEHRTEIIARALGWDGLPLPEQRRRIKQVKDRLKKRQQRGQR